MHDVLFIKIFLMLIKRYVMSYYVKKTGVNPVIIHGLYLPKNAIYGKLQCSILRKWRSNTTTGRRIWLESRNTVDVQFYCDDFRYAPGDKPAFYIHVYVPKTGKWQDTNTLYDPGYSVIFDAIDDYIAEHNMWDVRCIPWVHHADTPKLRSPKCDDIRKVPNPGYTLNPNTMTDHFRTVDVPYVPAYVGDPMLRRRGAENYRKNIMR